ncbi:MAG: GNAT family N-acetyltransferase [Planctomycetaceae bacterium]
MTRIATFQLVDRIDGQAKPAELWDSIEPVHRQQLDNEWRTALTDLLARTPEGRREESAGWNWLDKLERRDGKFGTESFAITCDGMVQAAMILDLSKASWFKETSGGSIVYVDFLQTAPWNWKRDWQPTPRYRGLGTIMLRTAIELSRELEFEGWVGLHSLPQSENFYRKCGMTEFWRDPDYECLSYFEMTAAQANALLNKGRP